jgi:hypothetical protein
VNCPLRAAPGFEAATTVNDSPVLPADGSTLNHAADDTTDHGPWFVVTFTTREPPSRPADQDVAGLSVNDPAAWVTRNVADFDPPATVTVTDLDEPGFGAAENTTTAPWADGSTLCDNQSAEYVTPTGDWFVDTTKSNPPPAGGAAHEDADNVNTGSEPAAWLTATVFDTEPRGPDADTVTVPDRAPPAFADADTTIRSPLTPDVGDTDNQSWFADADHDSWFVVTPTVNSPPTATAEKLDFDNDNDGDGPAACDTDTVLTISPATTVTVAVRAKP